MADGVDKVMSVTLKADIHDLKTGLDQSRKQIKTLTNEFKASTAGLDNWKESEVGLNAKLKQLNETISIQAQQITKTTSVYERSKAELGENHMVTIKYRNQLLNLQAAQGKAEKEQRKYTASLAEIKNTIVETVDANNVFKSSLENLDAKIGEANATFNSAISGMENWEEQADGLRAKVTQLNAVFEAQKNKLSTLEAEYQRVAQEQGETSTEAIKLRTQILNQKTAIGKTESELKNYDKKLEQASKTSKKTKKDTDKLGNSIKGLKSATGEASKGFTVLKGVMSQVITRALVGFFQSLTSSIRASQELTKELGFLNATAITTGSNFDNAKENLIEIGAITNDTGAAVEGLNNLMTAGFDGDMLDQITDQLVGASIKWKDTLKFEGLSDGLQETLATGKAIGPFAEMLERAGVNLDVFNAGLIASQTPAQKQQFVLDKLANLGLKEVKDEYEKLNETLIDNNAAVITQQVAYAKLNDAIMPLKTTLLTMGTSLIEKIEPSVRKLVKTIQKVLGGDFKGAFEDASQVVSNFSKKVINTLIKLLENIPDIIKTFIDTFVSEYEKIVPKALELSEKLYTAFVKFIYNLIERLPEILKRVVELIEKVIPMIVDMIIKLGDMIQELLPKIIDKILELIPQIIKMISGLIKKLLPVLVKAILSLVENLVNMLPEIVESLKEIIPDIITSIFDLIVENAPIILEAIITIVRKIIDLLPTLIDLLITELPHLFRIIVASIVENWPKIMDAINQLIWQIVDAIPTIIPGILKAILSVIKAMIETIANKIVDFTEIGKLIVDGFVKGFVSTWKRFTEGISNFWNNLVNSFKNFFGIHSPSTLFAGYGENIVQGLWNGIKDRTKWLKDKIKGFGKTVSTSFKDVFEINSPSELMRDEVGKYIGLGVGEGIIDSTKAVLKDANIFSNKISKGLASKIGTINGGLSLTPALNGVGSTSNVNNFTQIINAPKQPSRIELYRQTRNLLSLKGGK